MGQRRSGWRLDPDRIRRESVGERERRARGAGEPRARRGRESAIRSQTNMDMRVQFAVDKAATGGGVYLYASDRRLSSTLEYATSMHLYSNGSLGVSIVAYEGSASGITLGSEVTLPFTVMPGTAFNVRMEVTGTAPTTISAKVWPAGATEPTGWTVTQTDSYAGLQVPGGIALHSYLSSGATNAPVTVSVDQLSAVSP